MDAGDADGDCWGCTAPASAATGMMEMVRRRNPLRAMLLLIMDAPVCGLCNALVFCCNFLNNLPGRRRRLSAKCPSMREAGEILFNGTLVNAV